MSDPREGFAFHGKGFYKAALRYQFDPALLGNRRADAAGVYSGRRMPGALVLGCWGAGVLWCWGAGVLWCWRAGVLGCC